MAILGVRVSPRPTLWLVSADERLGRVRLVSTDVRDVTDVTAWLAPLPFQGMVFSIRRGKLPCADDYKPMFLLCGILITVKM